jgi:hypothetical protein
MEARLSSTELMGVRPKPELTCFRYSHEWRWGPWSANQDISTPRSLFVGTGLTLEQGLFRATGGLGSGAGAVLEPWPLPAPARSGGGSFEKECLWRRETRLLFKGGFALKELLDAVLYK